MAAAHQDSIQSKIQSQRFRGAPCWIQLQVSRRLQRRFHFDRRKKKKTKNHSDKLAVWTLQMLADSELRNGIRRGSPRDEYYRIIVAAYLTIEKKIRSLGLVMCVLGFAVG